MAGAKLESKLEQETETRSPQHEQQHEHERDYDQDEPNSDSEPEPESEPESEPGSGSSSSKLQTLRALAQSHLQEIQNEDQALSISQAASQASLQKYVKVRRRDRVASSSTSGPSGPSTTTSTNTNNPSSNDGHEKKPRFRTASEILSRLRHDSSYRLSDFVVGYVERFEGIKEIEAEKWIRESTDEDWIPLHRVRYVRRKHADGDTDGEGTKVWDRDGRVDLIFNH